MLTYLLTTSSLQEVMFLKDNNLEDIIGVPCHPDKTAVNKFVRLIAAVFLCLLVMDSDSLHHASYAANKMAVQCCHIPVNRSATSALNRCLQTGRGCAKIGTAS